MNEPQLELTSDEMRVSYENQATDEDYIDNNYNVNRGHLFPSCHSGDEVTARSTFTLTNAVPQKISFNSGSWNRLEIKAIEVMDNYCRDKKDQNKVLAHVLTGAVPNKDKKQQLKDRVNIPSSMWMTFCCYNSTSSSWASQAYWALNKDEKLNDNVMISEISLKKLQEILSKNFEKNTQLFKNDCENKIVKSL
ncbi:endonuclease domain-containing 1 protein-like [Misgurnus anguillicaudatus]|uniref:endonuclease domain-containing 1 protein-like n=1 Tax=Misgurnus anguillicaudatus TaxID=75329 RepID=UPI003CCFA741